MTTLKEQLQALHNAIGKQVLDADARYALLQLVDAIEIPYVVIVVEEGCARIHKNDADIAVDIIDIDDGGVMPAEDQMKDLLDHHFPDWYQADWNINSAGELLNFRVDGTPVSIHEDDTFGQFFGEEIANQIDLMELYESRIWDVVNDSEEDDDG